MTMQTLSNIHEKYPLYLILSNRFAKLCHYIVTSTYAITKILQN